MGRCRWCGRYYEDGYYDYYCSKRCYEADVLKEINRDIDCYNIGSIARASSIYQNLLSMHNKFLKLSHYSCSFGEYAKEVLYRLEKFDGAVERFYAEKKAVEQREDQQRQEELRNILLKHIA